MHRLAKLMRATSRLDGRIVVQRAYAKEVKFGATAREEMIAGNEVPVMCRRTYSIYLFRHNV